MTLANQANETSLLWPKKILGLFIFCWPFPESIESLTYNNALGNTYVDKFNRKHVMTKIYPFK